MVLSIAVVNGVVDVVGVNLWLLILSLLLVIMLFSSEINFSYLWWYFVR